MLSKKINVLIAGATGYVGLDLTLLLSKHKNINIKYLCAQKGIGKKISTFDKRIKTKLPKISNLTSVNYEELNLVFLSLPNGEAQKLIKKLYKYSNLKFIDLSADFRLTNPSVYKKFYKKEHKAKDLIKYSKYCISEFAKKDIKKFRIIGNPGCYPTSIQLPLIPLIKKKLIKFNNIIIDSKSGYSGAGKNFNKKFKHKNLFSSIQAYGELLHRHVAEIDQEFNKINKSNIQYSFNPHLIPTFRGLLSSIYLEIDKKINITKIYKSLKKYHKKNKFIKINKLNKKIGTSNVLNTNLCEISVCNTRCKNKIVIYSAIDNLVKGASGQAVQNMNIMYNFKEQEGIQ